MSMRFASLRCVLQILVIFVTLSDQEALNNFCYVTFCKL